VEFCRHVAIDARDIGSVKKILIANTKCVDKRAVYGALFAGGYLHWQHIEDTAGTNSIGGFDACIALVGFLDFEGIEAKYKVAGAQQNLVYLFRFASDVVACGLPLSMAQVACAALLANLQGLAVLNVLEQYTSRELGSATHRPVCALAARMADYRFGTAEYGASLVWLLRQCAVRAEFAHELQTFFTQKETVASAMRLRHLEVGSGRPRLLDKLARRPALATREVKGDAMDGFQNWVARVRFPNTISQRLKRRLYFAMSQPHVDHATVVGALANAALAPAVLRERIARPEESVLCEVLEGLEMRQAPFAELTQFMRSCFRAFPQKDLRELTFPVYTQLYIASYQHGDLWKSCWTRVHPLLSYQVIRDVEEFTARTPFNQHALVEILQTT
jgi:hypothetical protein